MPSLEKLPIKIFADGADKEGMFAYYKNPLIRGLTTNPTLMRKAGISDYETFAREVLEVVREKPISFEVFTDDFPEMKRQALKISAWQNNVYVKIPITNTRGESACPLIQELSASGVRVNVTALLSETQVSEVIPCLTPGVPVVLSLFAGRIADTGRDPCLIVRHALALMQGRPEAELLWASVREILNIFQAAGSGCHIVTVNHDILAKALKMAGQDLEELSLETVRMFHADAQSAGYKL